VRSEQVSFVLGHKTLLTFQERQGDVWDSIRQRIGTKGSRLRQNDVSFLIYSLLDAMIDQCFPILEFYSELLEDLEDQALTTQTGDTIRRIYAAKRELLVVRRCVWPMREVINSLQREKHECMSEVTRTYLRDLYDNCVQIIDLVETYREFATGLTELYMSALSIRMNEIMKVLTIMGSIFIPLTFLAGVYGMNMPIPETHSN
jgi:magnesium transporter